MKNYILLLLIFGTFSFTFSQKSKTLDRKNLLKLFKTLQPFDAQDSIFKTNYHDLDFKSLYYDLELKPYFLKCLDQKTYFEKEMKIEIEKYKKVIANKDRLNDEIKTFLFKKNMGKQINKILKNPKLISKYKDSVISARMLSDLKNENIANYVPSTELLSRLKYPEVYTALKKWSLSSKSLELNRDLLRFNDPDSQRDFNIKVDNYIKTNGKNEFYSIFSNKIQEANSSYTFSKLIDLMNVNKEELVMQGHTFIVGEGMASDDVFMSANFILLGSCNFFYQLNYYKLPFDKLIKDFSDVPNNNPKMQDKFIKKNLPEIKKAILELVKIKEKEEEYWMVNMPFYKRK